MRAANEWQHSRPHESARDGHRGSTPRLRFSKKRLALAFALAALSDGLSLLLTFTPPLQWALDLVTALLLFLVLGWQWVMLPGLILEAIPGFNILPLWVLVVGAVALLGTVRPDPKALLRAGQEVGKALGIGYFRPESTRRRQGQAIEAYAQTDPLRRHARLRAGRKQRTRLRPPHRATSSSAAFPPPAPPRKPTTPPTCAGPSRPTSSSMAPSPPRPSCSRGWPRAPRSTRSAP